MNGGRSGMGPERRGLAGVGALTALLAGGLALAERADVSAGQVQAALEKAYGVHAGQRRNHTKGTCALGEFVGAPAVGAYSRSSLFSGQPVPVVARFSLAGGDPRASDLEKSPRGMALELRLPGGSLQHMTMIDTPVFFASVPRTFLDKMVALIPDPKTDKPDPASLAAFVASHPDAVAQSKLLASRNPPASYADDSYFGIHTFKLVNRGGVTTLVRWRFAPQGGERRLTDAQLASAPRDFLERELMGRTAGGPVRWDMWLTLGEAHDPQDDPTLAWPKDRKEIRAGTLTISQAMPQRGAGCEGINYDPLVMGDGIQATNDPVLRFRSPSYGLSFSARLQGK
jgi:catalase